MGKNANGYWTQLPTSAMRVIATIMKKFTMPVFNEES